MSRRLIHNLLLASAVVALALFLLLRPEKAGPQRFALSALTPDRITRIELAPRNGVTMVLERQGRDWRLAAPFRARADRFRVEAVLSILTATSQTRLSATHPAKFGLAPPYLRLRLVAAGQEQVFDFGDRQPVSNQLYVATQGWIHLVSPVHLVDVSRGPEDFAAKNPLAEDESPVAFGLPGLALRQEQGRWRREPDDGRLSADQLNRFADEWRLATAASVRRASPAPASETLTVGLADGRTLRFGLLARQPEVVLRREDEGMEYHFAPDAGARLLDPTQSANP